MGRTSYHHGDLRAALIAAGMELIAEKGVPALSVAETARRTEVSPGAPYRHFPNREALLVAIAITAAEQLASDFRAATERSARCPEPADRLAEAARAYVRFVAQHRAGFDLVYAPELRPLQDPDLRQAGRSVMDLLLPLAMEAADDDPSAAMKLIEQFMAVAHGYACLYVVGFFGSRGPEGLEELAGLAAETTRRLASVA